MAELEQLDQEHEVEIDLALGVAFGPGGHRHGGIVHALESHEVPAEGHGALGGLLQLLGEVADGLGGDGRELRLGVQQSGVRDDGLDFGIGRINGRVLPDEVLPRDAEDRLAGAVRPMRESGPSR